MLSRMMLAAVLLLHVTGLLLGCGMAAHAQPPPHNAQGAGSPSFSFQYDSSLTVPPPSVGSRMPFADSLYEPRLHLKPDGYGERFLGNYRFSVDNYPEALKALTDSSTRLQTAAAGSVVRATWSAITALRLLLLRGDVPKHGPLRDAQLPDQPHDAQPAQESFGSSLGVPMARRALPRPAEARAQPLVSRPENRMAPPPHNTGGRGSAGASSPCGRGTAGASRSLGSSPWQNGPCVPRSLQAAVGDPHRPLPPARPAFARGPTPPV